MAMIAPMFIPSRWRRPARAPGYAAPGESPLGQLATVAASTGGSAETAGADPDPTVAGFAAPLGGESNMLPDETQTRPQQGPVIPPGGYQAP